MPHKTAQKSDRYEKDHFAADVFKNTKCDRYGFGRPSKAGKGPLGRLLCTPYGATYGAAFGATFGATYGATYGRAFGAVYGAAFGAA